METITECCFGHEKTNITISVFPVDGGFASIKWELFVGISGSVEILGHKVVDPSMVRGELESFLGKAWNWFDVTGINLTEDALIQSATSEVALLKSAKAGFCRMVSYGI